MREEEHLQECRELIAENIRHEILNELDKETVYADVADWIAGHM